MTTEIATATAEAEIRDLVESWARAVRANDIDGIAAHYASDILAFDAISQLRFKGLEAYRRHWEACLAMCPGPMIFEIHDLEVAAGGDVAFAHCLNRCGVEDDSGEVKASYMRGTFGCRRVAGRWRIVHEHWSAPFDMESNKALLDLEP